MTPPAQDEVDKEAVGADRLLTFSDGVFAIAATLLVLDLRQPNVSTGLLNALASQWSEYLSYALSFLIIGIIWAQRHRMFSYIRRTDHMFIIINVFFVMWVAVLPFPTAVVARYLENASEQQTATAVHTALTQLRA